MKKLLRVLVLGGLLLLVIGLAVFGFLLTPAAPSPVDPALNKLVADGYHASDLVLKGSKVSSGLLGDTGQVDFQLKGSEPKKGIRVDLRRPMFTTTWQVSAYTEEELGQ